MIQHLCCNWSKSFQLFTWSLCESEIV